MAAFFPRFALAPVRCAAPTFRQEIAPLWSLFDDTMREIQQVQRVARRQQRFNPRFDLKEDKDSYILEGEVPGFNEKDLSIEWNDNILAIRGRHEARTESGKQAQAPAVTDAAAEETKAATDDVASETNKSTKSYQATVEDEQPANASAVAAESTKVAAPKPTETKEVAPTQPEVQHWISERSVGEFLRQFRFSNKVDHEAIKASLQSGILKIVVPKASPAIASRHINIE